MGRRRPWWRCPGPGLAIAATLAVAASAGPAQGQVTKVEWKQDLFFGDVWTGTSKTLQPNDSDASQWAIEANQGTSVTLSFSLPANLVSGGNTLPIGFATDAAAWDHDSSPTGYTRFNPTQSATVVVSGSKQVYVWLGGGISPPYSQPAGDYAGTITLIVTVN